MDGVGIKSKWLTGRGTKVLYGAVALIIWCGIGSGAAMIEANNRAQVAVTNSVQIAQVTLDACQDKTFYAEHVDGCIKASKVTVDPSAPVVPVSPDDQQAVGR